MATRQTITKKETREATHGSDPSAYGYGPGEVDYITHRMLENGKPASGPMIDPNILYEMFYTLPPSGPKAIDRVESDREIPQQFIPDKGNSLFRQNFASADAGTMNDASGMPPVQSNTLGKGDMGQMPGMMEYMVNSLMATLGGTQFGRDPNAMSYGPERTMGGAPVSAPAVTPPMPEPNPQMRPMSPDESELGMLFNMVHPAQVGPFPAPPVLPPIMDQNFTTEEVTVPPPPVKKSDANKPKRVEKKEKPGKPQRAQPKGERSKSEPKQVTPPPRRR